jgi:stringent starvation protein B
VSDAAPPAMTSNRPYLLRALYDWISDNDLTPYLLVDARVSGVRVPAFAVRDGQVVLNVAMRAVADLELGNDRVRFKARFGGVSHAVEVPVGAVLAIYAHENGQGMMFPAEPVDSSMPSAESPKAPEPEPPTDPPPRKGPVLRIVK